MADLNVDFASLAGEGAQGGEEGAALNCRLNAPMQSCAASESCDDVVVSILTSLSPYLLNFTTAYRH